MPPGVPGVSKEPKEPKDYNHGPFFANVKQKRKKIWKLTKKRHFLTIFVDFEGFYAIHSILAEN